MAQVINTNSLSLMTQNNLNKSQSALGTAIERLSSGLRINSAKDDAAGQAISNRFTSNITGLTQASRNANDGISVAQTTEGSLSEINNNLQRIRELTVQAQNGTNSSSDLDSIQDEITSRLSEIDRVSGQTQFNGVKVLAKDSTMSIQVGANDGETIKIDLKAITADTLGLSGFNVNGKGSVANTAATLTDLTSATTAFAKAGAAAADGTQEYTRANPNTAAKLADVISGVASTTGSTVTADVDTGFGTPASNTYSYDKTTNSYSYTVDSTAANPTAVVNYLNPNAGDTTKASVDVGGTKQDVIIAKDGTMTAADDNSALYLDTTGNLTKNSAGSPPVATLAGLTASGKVSTVTTASGTEIDIAADNSYNVKTNIAADKLQTLATTSGFSASVGGQTYTVGANAATVSGYVADGKLTTNLTTTQNFFAHTDGSITNGSGSKIYKDEAGNFGTDAATISAATKDPLAALDSAIASVDEFRSSLGAVQNRFDSAITNLNNTTTNLASAQSRIQDADYATEVSAMSKAQILQQAGTSVLSKANQVPQSVLSLLQ
ncbi:FliC/FljB family flagellin [Rahnella inusitata]|uniref:FliC/FljB family flagellin n=1 Tax=Rahnella inusitata TaxID=58169 RepID=UPI0039BEC331